MNHNTTTEGDLFLDLLADPTKLKPISKTVNVEKIDERNDDSDDSHLVNNPRKSNGFVSSDSSTSSRRRSTESRRSRRSRRSDSSKSSSSSSSTSSRRHRRSSDSSKSHRRMDDYINEFNSMGNKDKKEEKRESTYIPKYETEREKKFQRMTIFFKLEDLKNNGIKLTKEYNLHSNIEEMEDELRFHEEREQRKIGVSMAKDGVLQATKWIENGNKWLDPFGAKLDGWHDQMATNIDNYGPVLGELYDKHKHFITKVEPEYKFIGMIAASALTFHYAKAFVEKNGLDDLVNKNPGMFEKIQSSIAGFLEKKVGKEEEPKEEEEYNKMSRQEMYKRMKEKEVQKQQPNRQQVPQQVPQQQTTPPQSNVDNMISEMMGGSNANAMNINIQKPRRLNELISNATKHGINNTINLNDSATATATGNMKSNVYVETVDSESITAVDRANNRRKARMNIGK